MTSPSTLIRRAAKAKSPRHAAKLRAQAAKLRREIRSAAKHVVKVSRKKKRKPSKIERALTEAINMTHDKVLGWRAVGPEETIGNQAINRLRPESEVAPKAPPPPLLEDAELLRLRKLARGRSTNVNDSFAIAVRSNMADAVVRGRKEMHEEVKRTEDIALESVKSNNEAHAIAVVSGFIAIVKHAGKYMGGPLPPTMTFTGHTVSKVYDALRAAGYTEEGKQGAIRNSRI